MRALCLLFCVVAGSAAADQNDFRIYKLGNPDPNGVTNAIQSANGTSRVFARQFAAAISSATLMPPETLGHAGFAFSAEVSIVSITEDPTAAKGVTLPTQAATLCKGPAVTDPMDGCEPGGGYRR